MPQSSEKKSSVMETSMIRDFARRVIDDFGDQTDSYVASRIGVLIRDGDSYGVGLWKAVASEIERIRIPEANVPRSRH
jgi:hypothetical protein